VAPSGGVLVAGKKKVNSPVVAPLLVASRVKKLIVFDINFRQILTRISMFFTL
jgi:hypothetical protein